MSIEADRRLASSTPAPTPRRSQRRAGAGTSALAVTEDIDGRIRVRVGPAGTVHQTDLRDASPQAHRQAALEALRIAGITFGYGLASAWRAPGLVAIHLVMDGAPQRGRHELPPIETRMEHSHLITGRLVRGRIYTEGLETARLSDVGMSLEEGFVQGARELAMTTGLPIADLRTFFNENRAISVFTTTPGVCGRRPVYSLEARIIRTNWRLDDAVTDEETSRLLDYARTLERYKEQEDDARAFIAAARRSRA